jgi:hypothetical protein
LWPGTGFGALFEYFGAYSENSSVLPVKNLRISKKCFTWNRATENEKEERKRKAEDGRPRTAGEN